MKIDYVANVTTLYVSPFFDISFFAEDSTLYTKYVTGVNGLIASVNQSVVHGGSEGVPEAQEAVSTQSTLYFHQDHLGNIVLTTNQDGASETQLYYEPYGKIFKQASSGPEDFRPKYGGKELDAASGLYYFEARYYNPVTGRFITADSELGGNIFEHDVFNRYAYTVNNPVNYSDPSGHSIEKELITVAVTATVLVGEVAIGIASDGAAVPEEAAIDAVIVGGEVGADVGIDVVADASTDLGLDALEDIGGDVTESVMDAMDGTSSESGVEGASEDLMSDPDADPTSCEDGMCFTGETIIITRQGSQAIATISTGSDFQDLKSLTPESLSEQFIAQRKVPGINEVSDHTAIFDNLDLSGYYKSPSMLLDYWGTSAIPISEYSVSELIAQTELNKQEAFVLSYKTEAGMEEWTRIDHEEITPFTWKWIDLEFVDKNGSRSLIHLRRPNWWLMANRVDAEGLEMHVDLPEMGIMGRARILAIRPNLLDTRLIEDCADDLYTWRPVTGKFVRESSDLWNVAFSGVGDTITTTGNHPFWSEERLDWIEISDFEMNEEVKVNRNTRSELSYKARSTEPDKVVYNLEVFRSHNYLVTDAGILVHNQCMRNNRASRQHKNLNRADQALFEQMERDIVQGKNSLLWRKYHDHQLDFEFAGQKNMRSLDFRFSKDTDTDPRGLYRMLYTRQDDGVHIHGLANTHLGNKTMKWLTMSEVTAFQ